MYDSAVGKGIGLVALGGHQKHLGGFDDAFDHIQADFQSLAVIAQQWFIDGDAWLGRHRVDDQGLGAVEGA